MRGERQKLAPATTANACAPALASEVAGEPRAVDRDLWSHIAGNAVRIPTVGSRVYYLPQGHLEHLSTKAAPDLSCVTKSWVQCWIADVKLLADPDSDEVFYKVAVVPGGGSNLLAPPALERRGNSFAKMLTQSDANNGGGFSVPRFCADSILPVLDFKADPPVQTIKLEDVHGAKWDFRHIFRGTPRRHLLTTGWTKFVNSKRLVAGDSVLFYRSHEGGFFIGVRRGWEGFRRNYRGRLVKDSVLEAVRLAQISKPFEVVFYPRGAAEFLVRAEVFEAAMRVPWAPGIKIRMAFQDDESNQPSFHYGTVACAGNQEQGPWSCSPWRTLQVAWDEPERKHTKCVSPWQVELVPATPQIFSPNIPKRLKGPQNPELLTDREGNMHISQSGINNTMIGGVTLSLLKDPQTPPEIMTDSEGNMHIFQSGINNTTMGGVILPLLKDPQNPELMTDGEGNMHIFQSGNYKMMEGVTLSSLKDSQNPMLMTNREGNMLIPQSGINNTTMGDETLPFLNSIFPAGMQGARQDTLYAGCIYSGDHPGSKIAAPPASTKLNIFSSHKSESISPPSHTSVLNCDSTEKSNTPSFMLFGKTIRVEEPAVCANKAVVNASNFSQSYPENQLSDASYQRFSASDDSSL